jgi:enoyl-CoA hydratase
MSQETVHYDVDGRVATVTLDRPRYRNAQSWRLLDELDAALERAQEDRGVRVVIVTGAGEHFSSGHDLGNLPKPTIAMVRGYCIYGGWMIASAMDVVFASPEARFLAGQVEYFSIPFDVGFRKAKELLFESRFIDAEEARALGFVNRVYPADRLADETQAWAARVAENGYGTLRMAKLAVNKMQDRVGFSSAMEAAFADFLVVSRLGGHPVPAPQDRRLGGVDLALRGARGERGGDESA